MHRKIINECPVKELCSKDRKCSCSYKTKEDENKYIIHEICAQKWKYKEI